MEETPTPVRVANPPAQTERGLAMRFFTKHPGVLLSGLYLFSSAIGMLDSWWYYRQFGINVFLYSDLADFLLASFRSPTAWLIVAYTVLVAAWEHVASLRRERSPESRRALRWLGSQRYRQASVVLAVAFVIGYIMFYADMRADVVAEGRDGQQVRVSLAGAPDGDRTAVLLGSTLHFMFLFEQPEGTVSVHPYENVLAIESNVRR